MTGRLASAVPHPDTLGDAVTREGAFVQYIAERRLGWVCPKCGTWTGPRYRYGSGAALAAYTKHTLWYCPVVTASRAEKQSPASHVEQSAQSRSQADDH